MSIGAEGARLSSRRPLQSRRCRSSPAAWSGGRASCCGGLQAAQWGRGWAGRVRCAAGRPQTTGQACLPNTTFLSRKNHASPNRQAARQALMRRGWRTGGRVGAGPVRRLAPLLLQRRPLPFLPLSLGLGIPLCRCLGCLALWLVCLGRCRLCRCRRQRLGLGCLCCCWRRRLRRLGRGLLSCRLELCLQKQGINGACSEARLLGAVVLSFWASRSGTQRMLFSSPAVAPAIHYNPGVMVAPQLPWAWQAGAPPPRTQAWWGPAGWAPPPGPQRAGWAPLPPPLAAPPAAALPAAPPLPCWPARWWACLGQGPPLERLQGPACPHRLAPPPLLPAPYRLLVANAEASAVLSDQPSETQGPSPRGGHLRGVSGSRSRLRFVCSGSSVSYLLQSVSF